ncbi:MAG: hypothetical protein HC850_04200 [Rhodomicrobium sp.]|nr:hypothetical protein [Rhodomicrobium sp.]
MNRRDFIKFASSFSVAAGLLEKEADAQTAGTPPDQGAGGPPAEPSAPPASADDAPPANSETSGLFTEENFVSKAETLARLPFAQPELTLPAELAELDQQQYRAIDFKPEAAVWKDEPINFALQFFHTGFQYKIPVAVNLVEGGVARPFSYSPLLFNFNQPLTPAATRLPGRFLGRPSARSHGRKCVERPLRDLSWGELLQGDRRQSGVRSFRARHRRQYGAALG